MRSASERASSSVLGRTKSVRSPAAAVARMVSMKPVEAVMTLSFMRT